MYNTMLSRIIFVGTGLMYLDVMKVMFCTLLHSCNIIFKKIERPGKSQRDFRLGLTIDRLFKL